MFSSVRSLKGSFVLVTLAVLLSGSNISSDADENVTVVGVSDFTTSGGSTDQQWIGNSCIDAITVKIGNQRNVRIVERKYLSKVMEELKLQASGLVDENTAVEIGNLVAVKYFIFGSAAVAGDKLVLRARIVDVSTSKVVFSDQAAGTLNDIFNLQEQLTYKIASALSLGNVENAPKTAQPPGYAAASKLEKIKKLADRLPFFALDPARKRKEAEYTLAINMCDDLIEKYPGLQKAHYYKGLFSIQASDLEAADAETKTARQLDNTDPEAFLARAFYFLTAEKFTEAKAILEYAVTEFPGDARTWYALSRVAMKEDDTPAAIEYLINSLKYSPHLPIAETNLRSLVTSSAFSPSDFSKPIYYDVARLYKVLYNTTGVIDNTVYKLAQSTVARTGQFAVPFYIMGVYELNQRKTAEAKEHLTRALQLRSTFAEAHRELGVAQLGSGECTSGRRHITLYMQSSNAVADHAELQKHIKNCY